MTDNSLGDEAYEACSMGLYIKREGSATSTRAHFHPSTRTESYSGRWAKSSIVYHLGDEVMLDGR